jgi:transcriptional regulator with XRE-family HTH domain
LHVSHLSKIERGGSNATLFSLLAIATALKMDMGELFSELASTSPPQTSV